jgi:hypothetical protein
MSLRDKLKRGPVEVHIPPADPMMTVLKEANTFSDQIKELVDQCSLSRQRSEWAMNQLATAHQVIRVLTDERDSYRSLYHNMVRASGELAATVNGLVSLGMNARNTILRVEHLNAQVPQPDPAPAPQQEQDHEEIDLDAALVGPSAPEPTPEEIERLRTTLASLPQQSQ